MHAHTNTFSQTRLSIHCAYREKKIEDGMNVIEAGRSKCERESEKIAHKIRYEIKKSTTLQEC